MKKRSWTIYIAGYAPFQMVALDGELDESEAQIAARVIWPLAEVV